HRGGGGVAAGHAEDERHVGHQAVAHAEHRSAGGAALDVAVVVLEDPVGLAPVRGLRSGHVHLAYGSWPATTSPGRSWPQSWPGSPLIGPARCGTRCTA